MKKVLLSILTFLYMAVSSGVAMELHYCMGDKAGMDLYGSSSDTCGKCGMTEKDTGCCHDEYRFYKINDSHKTVFNDIDLAAASEAVINDHYIYDWQLPDNNTAIAVNNHSPPGYTEPPARIMHGVFRI